MLYKKVMFGLLLLTLVSIEHSCFCAEEGARADQESSDAGSSVSYDIQPKCLRCFEHPGPIDNVRFNSNGDKILAIGSEVISVWGMCEGDQLLLSDQVTDAWFSRDGSHVIAKRKERDTPLVQWEFKNRVFRNPAAITSGDDDCIVSRRRHECEIAIDRCAVLIINRRTKRAAHVLRHKKRVNAVELNSDGTKIVSGLSDGTVSVWTIGKTTQQIASELLNRRILCRIESNRVVEALTHAGF